MDHTTFLGQSNIKVTRIGLGALTWGRPTRVAFKLPSHLTFGSSDGPKQEELALEVSLAAGVNLVDTAARYNYGASEDRLGELALGKNVVIATKFSPTTFSIIDEFPKSLKGSLKRLRRSTIDLYQIHFPSRWWPIPKLMNLMADAVEAGTVRAVGVSNYSAAEMRLAHEVLAMRGIPLASNQVEYSLLYRKPEVDGVLDTCKELGITLIAYSPLAQGALTGKYTSINKASGMRKFFRSFRAEAMDAILPVITLLREIGDKHAKSPSQIALRWLIENEHVIPIPGAKNSYQAAENANALSFSLTSEDVEKLHQATLPWRNYKK